MPSFEIKKDVARLVRPFASPAMFRLLSEGPVDAKFLEIMQILSRERPSYPTAPGTCGWEGLVRIGWNALGILSRETGIPAGVPLFQAAFILWSGFCQRGIRQGLQCITQLSFDEGSDDYEKSHWLGSRLSAFALVLLQHGGLPLLSMPLEKSPAGGTLGQVLFSLVKDIDDRETLRRAVSALPEIPKSLLMSTDRNGRHFAAEAAAAGYPIYDEEVLLLRGRHGALVGAEAVRAGLYLDEERFGKILRERETYRSGTLALLDAQENGRFFKDPSFFSMASNKKSVLGEMFRRGYDPKTLPPPHCLAALSGKWSPMLCYIDYPVAAQREAMRRDSGEQREASDRPVLAEILRRIHRIAGGECDLRSPVNRFDSPYNLGEALTSILARANRGLFCAMALELASNPRLPLEVHPYSDAYAYSDEVTGSGKRHQRSSPYKVALTSFPLWLLERDPWNLRGYPSGNYLPGYPVFKRPQLMDELIVRFLRNPGVRDHFLKTAAKSPARMAAILNSGDALSVFKKPDDILAWAKAEKRNAAMDNGRSLGNDTPQEPWL